MYIYSLAICTEWQFTSSLPIWILFFFFLVSLLWLGLLILCWREMVTVDILFLFQILARRLSDSHCYCIGCGCVINSFYYIEICYLYTLFGKSFYHEWILNFFKRFFYIFWDDLVVFYFSFVNVVYCIDSHISKKATLWAWNESHVVMVCHPFYGLLDLVC